MKNSHGVSASYKRYIKKLTRIRSSLGTTQERAFIDDAIAALRDGDIVETVVNLKCCFDSVNLKSGELMEIKNMVKSISPRWRDQIMSGFPWLSPIWTEISQELKVSILCSVVKVFYDTLSIYFKNEKRYYSRETCFIAKTISFRTAGMEFACM